MPSAKSARSQPAPPAEGFGDRLVRARKAAGYTQQQLADTLGISRRTVVYYEDQDAPPMAVFLMAVTGALGVSADELLGLQPPSAASAPVGSAKLARRLAALEALSSTEQRQVLELLDALIERASLKQASKR